MLASINPLGERARERRWGVTVGAYLMASTATAALFGAVLGAAGSVLPLGPFAVALAVVALSALALAADLGRLPLPTVHRQVDGDWVGRYRGWVVGVGFGAQLGLGVVTIVNTAATYLMLTLALLTGSAVAGALVGATFGLGRSLVILVVARVHRPDQLRTALRHVQAWRPVSERIGIAVQALVLVAAGAVAIAH